MKCMVQLGIAYPQKAIATALCPAIPSVKASEFGWRFATAIKKKEFAAAKQSASYGSPKERKEKKKVFSRVLKGKCRNKAGVLRSGWCNVQP